MPNQEIIGVRCLSAWGHSFKGPYAIKDSIAEGGQVKTVKFTASEIWDITDMPFIKCQVQLERTNSWDVFWLSENVDEDRLTYILKESDGGSLKVVDRMLTA